MRTQGLYSVARSAGAVMFESNVREQFYLSDGEIVTESLFGFSFIPDNATVTKGAVAVGFSCGAPPEPTVSTGEEEMMGVGLAKLHNTYGLPLFRITSLQIRTLIRTMAHGKLSQPKIKW